MRAEILLESWSISMRGILLLLGLCLSGALWADTVWLDNGDRLTGKIVLMDGGKLVLKTRYAGQVTIDWKDIDTLRSEKPLLVKRNLTETLVSERLEAAGSGMVRVVNGKEVVMPLAEVHQLIPPRPLLEDRVWEGNLDAKLDLERNEDETDEFKIKGDTRISHGLWRHVASGQLEHETKNGVKKDDNWEVEYDLDRFITDNWYWRTSYDQQEDEFEDIYRQRLYGAGPGYRFWDNELGRFELIGQFNRAKLDSRFGDAAFDLWSAEMDYKRLLWGTRVEFYSKAEVQVPTIEEIDYIIDAEAGLRYRVNEWARLSLLYELDQLRGLGQTQSERRYLIGLGVGW